MRTIGLLPSAAKAKDKEPSASAAKAKDKEPSASAAKAKDKA